MKMIWMKHKVLPNRTSHPHGKMQIYIELKNDLNTIAAIGAIVCHGGMRLINMNYIELNQLNAIDTIGAIVKIKKSPGNIFHASTEGAYHNRAYNILQSEKYYGTYGIYGIYLNLLYILKYSTMAPLWHLQFYYGTASLS
jgi:hypothetical protein